MKTLDIGGILVDRIAEDPSGWLDSSWLFGNIDPELMQRNAHAMEDFVYNSADNQVCLSFHSYLLRVSKKNILIDTCVGNDKHRPATPFWHHLTHQSYLKDLAHRGLTPKDIDIVMCTHLHTDHVGWNTRLEDGDWVPTFPNARYIFGRREYEYHQQRHLKLAATDPTPFTDSVQPIVEAGLAEMVEWDSTFKVDENNTFTLIPSPGHTPGHFCIALSGRSQNAIVAGDVVHHASQFLEPQLSCFADVDPELARKTRQRIFAQCCETDSILLSGHFPGPTVGKLTREGNNFSFRFLD